jgi:hypothetical protein
MVCFAATKGTKYEYDFNKKGEWILNIFMNREGEGGGIGDWGLGIADLRFTIYDFGLGINDLRFTISDLRFPINDFRLLPSIIHLPTSVSGLPTSDFKN